MSKGKVHLEDPAKLTKTLCGRTEKYLDKRKQFSTAITCNFCRNLHLFGSNRGDLRRA